VAVLRPRPRLVVRALAVALAIAVAPFLASTPAHAETSHTYLQFNMCGNSCNRASMAVADDVIRWIYQRSQPPLVVTLEEVCRSQYDHIYFSGELASYFGRFETTIPGRCDDGSDYGIAILLKTSNFSLVGSWWLPESDEPSDEDRKLVCLKTTATGGGSQPLVACVTHIEPDAAVYDEQIEAVADYLRPLWSDNHIMVGGDFNVTPKASQINPMYETYYSPAGTGIFNEADAPASFNRNTQGTKTAYNESTDGSNKIDYIFLSRFDFTNYSGEATKAPHSDHDALWAVVTFV
jgi:endonuclease/exonuclease/phosphatase family metal-dependent hydrolase